MSTREKAWGFANIGVFYHEAHSCLPPPPPRRAKSEWKYQKAMAGAFLLLLPFPVVRMHQAGLIVASLGQRRSLTK